MHADMHTGVRMMAAVEPTDRSATMKGCSMQASTSCTLEMSIAKMSIAALEIMLARLCSMQASTSFSRKMECV